MANYRSGAEIRGGSFVAQMTPPVAGCANTKSSSVCQRVD